jgi:hypothetical protein
LNILQSDLEGINEAKNYWQAYFDKYTFEHEVLAGAVDKEASAAFCFWLDRVRQVLQILHDAFKDPLCSVQMLLPSTFTTAPCETYDGYDCGLIWV